MVGRMAQVSVTNNDQVFAVGADDRIIYHRTGVSLEDLTGKRWRGLRAPLQVSRASSNASLNRDKFHRSFNSLVIFFSFLQVQLCQKDKKKIHNLKFSCLVLCFRSKLDNL